MYSTSELDELFQILNSIKGFKLNNHKGATQHYMPMCLVHSLDLWTPTGDPLLNTNPKAYLEDFQNIQ